MVGRTPAAARQLASRARRRVKGADLPARRLHKVTKYTIVTRSKLRVRLNDARARGYAVEQQEFEEGVACLAASYVDAAGSVAGSLTVAMPVAQLGISESAIAKTVKYYASQASHPASQEGP